jgi:ZIP family zinc transporter
VKIALLWSAIAIVCGLASAAGYALLGNASSFVLAVVQSFAGGAILMMLANTMIPEAYEHAGKSAGVATVVGFAVAVWVVVLEHAGAG